MSRTAIQETAFYRFGKWTATHQWRVIVIWLLVLAGSALFAPLFGENLTTTSIFVRDSQAKFTQDVVQQNFSQSFTEQDILVFHSKQLEFHHEAYQKVVEDVLAKMNDVEGIQVVSSPLEQSPQSAALLSSDQQTVLAMIGMTGTTQDIEAKAQEINTIITRYSSNNAVDVYFTGSTPIMKDMIEKQTSDIAKAEIIGVPLALVVLIIAFGSLVAASLPIILGIVGLLMTFGLLGVISYVHPFDTSMQSITSMIGLGIGIDYVLFMVRRFREELATGKSPVNATACMMATTGKAIFFSGLTVLVSMAGLYWLQASIFTNMAIGTTLVVACMMAVSLTLLPAVLSLLGNKINVLRMGRRMKDASAQCPSGWLRWSRFVMKRPMIWASVGVIILLLLSTQAFGLTLGMSSGTNTIQDFPSGKGMKLVEQNFSSGLLSPVNVVIQSKKGSFDDRAWASIEKLVNQLQQEAEVYRIDSIVSIMQSLGLPVSQENINTLPTKPEFQSASALWNFDQAGDTTVIRMTLNQASDSTSSTQWVRKLRDELLPNSMDTSVFDAYVGGVSMSIAELSDETQRKTPIVILTVLLLSYILLLVTFRSWLIPLKAIVLNLLSVGASFGILVWVFLSGHGAWIGVEQIEFIQVFLPVISFAVLFGLSMDYEVFLVGRMKEEWGKTRQVDEAIAQGISRTSGPITQAATIMIAIFLSFLFTEGDTKQIGFALGVAILIDVTIVRCLLVPSFMKLLGEKAWSLPPWLDRRLPHVELSEGEVPVENRRAE
jgi:RND superfamily putative drug exporter